MRVCEELDSNWSSTFKHWTLDWEFCDCQSKSWKTIGMSPLVNKNKHHTNGHASLSGVYVAPEMALKKISSNKNPFEDDLCSKRLKTFKWVPRRTCFVASYQLEHPRLLDVRDGAYWEHVGGVAQISANVQVH
jgi:hypothetical protein